MKPLSQEMVDAYDYAKANGDVLVLHPGFWGASNLARCFGNRTFGSRTVHALVTRNLAEYTEWLDGQHKRPSAIRLLAPPKSP